METYNISISIFRGKATAVSNFDLYPVWRFHNGTIRETGNNSWCESTAEGLGSGFNSYLIEDNYVSILSLFHISFSW